MTCRQYIWQSGSTKELNPPYEMQIFFITFNKLTQPALWISIFSHLDSIDFLKQLLLNWLAQVYCHNVVMTQLFRQQNYLMTGQPSIKLQKLSYTHDTFMSRFHLASPRITQSCLIAEPHRTIAMAQQWNWFIKRMHIWIVTTTVLRLWSRAVYLLLFLKIYMQPKLEVENFNMWLHCIYVIISNFLCSVC